MSKPLARRGDNTADASHAYDSERRTVDLVSVENVAIVDEVVGTACVEPAGNEIAGERHQQGKGHVGGRSIDEAGRVTDRQTAGLRIFEDDVVYADAEVAQAAKPGHFVHERARDDGMAVYKEAFDSSQNRVLFGQVPDMYVAGVRHHFRHFGREGGVG